MALSFSRRRAMSWAGVSLVNLHSRTVLRTSACVSRALNTPNSPGRSQHRRQLNPQKHVWAPLRQLPDFVELRGRTPGEGLPAHRRGHPRGRPFFPRWLQKKSHLHWDRHRISPPRRAATESSTRKRSLQSAHFEIRRRATGKQPYRVLSPVPTGRSSPPSKRLR